LIVMHVALRVNPTIKNNAIPQNSILKAIRFAMKAREKANFQKKKQGPKGYFDSTLKSESLAKAGPQLERNLIALKVSNAVGLSRWVGDTELEH